MSGQSTTPPAKKRAPRPQIVLTVDSVTRLSPHMVRITAGGPGFEAFADNDCTDKYVKILFADPRYGLTPPYDLEYLRANHPEQLPVKRTYTVRSVDAERQQITLDFVLHGDSGVAGPWAQQATVGDTLVFLGPGGGYRPDPAATFHLLVGDLSALPAILAALAELPADAVGALVLEIHDEADRLAEITELLPAGVQLVWADDADALAGESSAALLTAVRQLELPADLAGVQAFVHGERSQMKKLRRYLFNELGLERSQLSLSAYWAQGRVEDEFQAEKQTPVGKIFED